MTETFFAGAFWGAMITTIIYILSFYRLKTWMINKLEEIQSSRPLTIYKTTNNYGEFKEVGK